MARNPWYPYRDPADFPAGDVDASEVAVAAPLTGDVQQVLEDLSEGGGPGGGGTLVDLGVILAADCTGGNSVDLQPLINAPVGSSVQLLVANTDFVQHDSDSAIDTVIYADSNSLLVHWRPTQSSPSGVIAEDYAIPSYIEDGAPFLFSGTGSLATVGSIHLYALVSGEAVPAPGTGMIGRQKVVSVPFAFDDADLLTGRAVYTPSVGQLLLDAWFSVTTGFDGTTPTPDIGQFSGGATQGLFNWAFDVNSNYATERLVTPDGPAGTGSPMLARDAARVSDGYPASLAAALGLSPYSNGSRSASMPRFTSNDPLELVVTQDGLPGGADPGATQGAAVLHLVIWAPNEVAYVAGSGSASDIAMDPPVLGQATAQAAIEALASAVRTDIIDYTADQLRNSSTVPLPVLPAPGVGKVNRLLSATGFLKDGSAPWSLSINANNIGYLGTTNPFFANDDFLYSGEIGIAHVSTTGYQYLAEAENMPIVIDGVDDQSGAVLDHALGSGGADYAPGDTFSFGGVGSGVVDTVDGGGAVLTYHLTNNGYGANVGNEMVTYALTGIGTGLTINVISITTSNGSARIWITYQVLTLP